MGLNRLCERSLLAVIPLMLTMPTILMVFLAIMWFGFSEAGGLVAVLAVVTPYVAVNMFEGTKAMDKSLAEMGRLSRPSRICFCTGSTYRNSCRTFFPPFVMHSARPGKSWPWPKLSDSNTASATCFFRFDQFDIKQTFAWIMMFVVLMLVLEHGVFARLESRAFAWRNSSRVRARA
jgi:NitT/TauT family transport system permease protein